MTIDKTAEGRRKWCTKKLEKAIQECETNNPETDLSRHIWNEKNLSDYRESLRNDVLNVDDPTCRGQKIFYVEPEGTLLQNEILIGLVVNYIRYNVEESTLLDRLLSNGKPVLRSDCMSETAPRSGEFVPISFDLIEQVIKRKDSPLLKKLYQYIDLSKYEEYSEEIAALIIARS